MIWCLSINAPADVKLSDLKFSNILCRYEFDANTQCTYFFSVKKLAVVSLNHAEQVNAIQFLDYIPVSNKKNSMQSILYPAGIDAARNKKRGDNFFHRITIPLLRRFQLGLLLCIEK